MNYECIDMIKIRIRIFRLFKFKGIVNVLEKLL